MVRCHTRMARNLLPEINFVLNICVFHGNIKAKMLNATSDITWKIMHFITHCVPLETNKEIRFGNKLLLACRLMITQYGEIYSRHITMSFNCM
jgi:hypothetical protein